MTSDFGREITNALTKAGVEARCDPVTRLLYSTDASIYQITPLGAAFPRTQDELAAAVEIVMRMRAPILARGSGSSLAGQAVGAGMILDCARHLRRILEINAQERYAIVEPGVILNTLNRAAAKHGLQFGPDPASAERATMGGSIGNNATGAHSILYGMAADHLVEAGVLLSDGSRETFGRVSEAEARQIAANGNGRLAQIYAAALSIRENYTQAILANWPRTWRRATGYALNYLLPWAHSAPQGWEAAQPGMSYPPVVAGTINLAPLLAGAEGTLGVIQTMKVRLVPAPRHTVLGVLAYDSVAHACDATPEILERNPSAVELIPETLIRMARSAPAYAPQVAVLDPLGGMPPALLAVEFSGDHVERLREQAEALGRLSGLLHPPIIAESPALQKAIWTVRKVGLGLLAARPGDFKSVAFIEDIAVPVERLGEFVREMEKIMGERQVEVDFYAHASAGCLHIRPMLNIKTAHGKAQMREIAALAAQLTLRLGGAISGEHGVGLARSEWLEQMLGEEVMEAFHLLKNAADPAGLLNPGKIVDAQPTDANLRFPDGYTTGGWQPVMDFSRQEGLSGAIEMCNGAGVCRKEEGVMCPSFQATRDEMHSTRGRANLLRALIASPGMGAAVTEDDVYAALDLCLACKGCKAECPSSVDMAKLRYEFMHHYYTAHSRRLRDYLFAYIAHFARLGQPVAPVANWLLSRRVARWLAQALLGIAQERPLPRLSRRTLEQMLAHEGFIDKSEDQPVDCLFLSDTFTHFFQPEVGLAAFRVLRAAGFKPMLLPILGAGRTLISKSFLDAAQDHARRLVASIRQIDPQGALPVIGVEPSEIYTLSDEFLDLLPGDPYVVNLAQRAWTVEEWLLRQPQAVEWLRATGADGYEGKLGKVVFHPHCYQRAQPPRSDSFLVGGAASSALLEAAGYSVRMIEAGCCGMAGAFGYESEHYEIAIRVGETGVLPAIRKALDTANEDIIISAAGVSCRAQIEDNLRHPALHPLELLDKIRP